LTNAGDSCDPPPSARLPASHSHRGAHAADLVAVERVRAQLAIPAELSILCGLAVGYPDPDFAVSLR
jgi:hypothetical protein